MAQDRLSQAPAQSGRRKGPAYPEACFVMDRRAFEKIYDADTRERLGNATRLYGDPIEVDALDDHADVLARAEIILSGWGSPKLDAAFLDRVPNLRLYLYGAGATDKLITGACRERGIRVSSAIAFNAGPVAEFTVAQIVLALKRAWPMAREIRESDAPIGDGVTMADPPPGCYGSTVGLVSLGHIGREVARRLRAMDLDVIAYEPGQPDDDGSLNHLRYGSLDEVFRRSDVVSLHTPLNAETTRMFTRAHFERMKPNAALINTARGRLIAQDELCEVLRKRTDLIAQLDVLDAACPSTETLRRLPNVFVTPHIAGSIGPECARLGRAMADELHRYLNHEPLRHRVV